MSTPPSKFFNRYEFDEDVRDERDRLRAVNGQLLAALEALTGAIDTVDDVYGAQAAKWLRECDSYQKARTAIAEAQKATGTQP